MIKLLKYLILITCLSSCYAPQKGIINDDNNDYEELINSVSESVKGMQFKALEKNRAFEIFDEYKIVKLRVIRNHLLKQNNDIETNNLIELRDKFNRLTMDNSMLEDIKNGYRENPYIEKFENLIVEQFIKLAESNMTLVISDLKIIYEN